MNFPSLGRKLKLKFELSRNFELTRFYCTNFAASKVRIKHGHQIHIQRTFGIPYIPFRNYLTKDTVKIKDTLVWRLHNIFSRWCQFVHEFCVG
jgi:hypothetical protein